MKDNNPSNRRYLPNSAVHGEIEKTAEMATHTKNARMSQSTGVRRIFPPRLRMSQPHAASAMSPKTRWKNTLIMSNWS